MLDMKTSILLYNAIALSVFDYANFICMSTTKNFMCALQILQNKFARCVLNVHSRSHSHKMLNTLQWLDVKEWSDFIKLCYVYRILSENVPMYLHNIFNLKNTFTDTSLPSSPCSSYQ